MKSLPLQRLGIIGHPIGHSLSPAMHSAAIDELHIPFTYGVFDVVDEFLPALVASLRKVEFAGANVTIPHKERIIPLLDAVDQDAVTIGAVNTIVNHNGKLTGYNTDVAGIQMSLESFKKKSGKPRSSFSAPEEVQGLQRIRYQRVFHRHRYRSITGQRPGQRG